MAAAAPSTSIDQATRITPSASVTEAIFSVLSVDRDGSKSYEVFPAYQISSRVALLPIAPTVTWTLSTGPIGGMINDVSVGLALGKSGLVVTVGSSSIAPFSTGSAGTRLDASRSGSNTQTTQDLLGAKQSISTELASQTGTARSTWPVTNSRLPDESDATTSSTLLDSGLPAVETSSSASSLMTSPGSSSAAATTATHKSTASRKIATLGSSSTTLLLGSLYALALAAVLGR